jgi:hypothetical protein
LALINSGVIDTWSSYSLSMINPHFLHTSPFGSDSYGLLFRRKQTNITDINFVGLLAGIDLSVYGLLLLALFILAVIACLNEMRDRVLGSNSHWHVINLVLVGGEDLQNNRGATRKVYSIVCGLTILLFNMYYQSKLLQQLLIPAPAQKTTIADIAERISKGATLYMQEFMYMELNSYAALREIKNALKYNPPCVNCYFPNEQLMDKILNENYIIYEDLMTI